MSVAAPNGYLSFLSLDSRKYTFLPTEVEAKLPSVNILLPPACRIFRSAFSLRLRTLRTKRPAKGSQKDICLGGWVVFDRPSKEKRQFFFTPFKEGFAILNTNSDIQLYFGCNQSSVHVDVIGYCTIVQVRVRTTSNRHHELPKGGLRQLPIRY